MKAAGGSRRPSRERSEAIEAGKPPKPPAPPPQYDGLCCGGGGNPGGHEWNCKRLRKWQEVTGQPLGPTKAYAEEHAGVTTPPTPGTSGSVSLGAQCGDPACWCEPVSRHGSTSGRCGLCGWTLGLVAALHQACTMCGHQLPNGPMAIKPPAPPQDVAELGDKVRLKLAQLAATPVAPDDRQVLREWIEQCRRILPPPYGVTESQGDVLFSTPSEPPNGLRHAATCICPPGGPCLVTDAAVALGLQAGCEACDTRAKAGHTECIAAKTAGITPAPLTLEQLVRRCSCGPGGLCADCDACVSASRPGVTGPCLRQQALDKIMRHRPLPKGAPGPARDECPTCGSDDREKRMYRRQGGALDSEGACDDWWHPANRRYWRNVAAVALLIAVVALGLAIAGLGMGMAALQ